MKKRKFMNLCSGMIFMAICSCSGSRSQSAITLKDCDVIAERVMVGQNDVVVCDWAKAVQTLEFPLSELLEDFKLIKLDNSSQECKVSVTNTFAVSANYISSCGPDGPARIFDKEGKFVRQIGNVGEGEEEYTPYASRVYIDERQQKVYITGIYTPKQILMEYSLTDGSFLKKIPLPTRTMLESIYVDDNQTIHFVHDPIRDFTEYLAWSQNENGEILSSIPAKTYWSEDYYQPEQGNWELSMTSLYPCGGAMTVFFDRYFTVPDSLYHYQPGQERLLPCFTVRFPNPESIPWHNYEEYTHYYMMTVYTGAAGSALPTKRMIVDKQTLKGANIDLVVDELGGLSLKGAIYHLCNGYFYYNLSPDNLKERIKKTLQKPELEEKQREKLNRILEGIAPNDNNYLMLGKLK